jgi:hypothetical protein
MQTAEDFLLHNDILQRTVVHSLFSDGLVSCVTYNPPGPSYAGMSNNVSY